MAFFRFISAPLSYLYYLKERLDWDLRLQFIFLIIMIISILIGAAENNAKTMIIYISIFGSFFYVLQTILSYKLSL
jgi:hypothetical protein